MMVGREFALVSAQGVPGETTLSLLLRAETPVSSAFPPCCVMA